MSQKTLEEIEVEIENLQLQRRNWLRSQGWEYTCDTPGARWLWQKQFPDGRVAMVEEATAIAIAEWLRNTRQA